MKVKSSGLKVSLAILLLSVLLSVLFHFCSWSKCTQNLRDYIVMLSVGASSSALVTLLIYLTEYKEAKVTTLENYWVTISHVLEEFGKLEYYHSGISLSLMDQAKLKLMLSQNKRDADNYLNKLNKVMDGYILLSKISYKEAENAIGHIGYFTGKKTWLKLYKDIHKPIRDKLNHVREEVYHFELYRSGEVNNIPVLLDKLYGLQEILFKKAIKGSFVCVYNNFYDEMSKVLEDFRASIYNCNADYQEPLCRYSYTKPCKN